MSDMVTHIVVFLIWLLTCVSTRYDHCLVCQVGITPADSCCKFHVDLGHDQRYDVHDYTTEGERNG